MMPNDDPGVEVAKKAFGYSTDCCFRFLRFFLISVAIVAVIFSFLALQSCELAVYNLPSEVVNASFTQEMLDDLADEWPQGTIGLFRHNPNSLGCVEFAPTGDELTTSLRVSRAGGTLGAVFGCLALLLLLVEFLCCRFCCSRIFIVLFLLVACICQLFTFCIFLQDTCEAEGENAYLCNIDKGSVYTLVASGLYFMATLLTCPTPKAVPLVYILKEMERNSVVDPFCCFKGRTSEDILEVNTELAELIERPEDEVTLDGVKYQQHYSSSAGVTLQDQYSAAYNDWVNSEAVYEKTLDRLKQECGELGKAWRLVRSQDPSILDDDELSRLVTLLNIQREKSELARLKMERFQTDLNLVMTPIEAEAVEEDELFYTEPKVAPWWKLRWKMPWMKKDNDQDGESQKDSNGDKPKETDKLVTSESKTNSNKSVSWKEVEAPITNNDVESLENYNDASIDEIDDMVPVTDARKLGML